MWPFPRAPSGPVLRRAGLDEILGSGPPARFPLIPAEWKSLMDLTDRLAALEAEVIQLRDQLARLATAESILRRAGFPESMIYPEPVRPVYLRPV